MLSTKFRTARLDSRRSAQNPTTHCLAPRSLLVGSLAFALIACTSSSTTNGSGGANGTGGSSSGGSSGTNSGGSSGSSTGGSSSNNGGSAKGGSSGTGGSSSNNGGSAKGGSSGTGGSSSNGGSAKGGSSGTGGSSSNTGGSSSNSGGSSGANNGGSSGTNNGGSSAGGTSGGTGGSAAGGSSGTGTNPPGWYATKDWGVTSVDWHGCVWTGIDCKSNCSAGITAVPGSTTSVTPADFTAATTEGGPYEVSGTVYNDYNSVALLGFDLTDTASGDATQCSNAKRDPAADGPPAITMPSSATGIAVNWSAAKAPPTSFRIQIQGVKGATDANSRWCATITDASGPSFVKFSDFNTKCWDNTGNKYNNEAIDAVAFLVPGTVAEKAPFDFTIVGFAPGTSAKDAPGKAPACGTMTGTLGSSTASEAASMQRASVTGSSDCKKYIVQNNNWGSKTGSTQIIDFTGNSFTIKSSSGSGSSAPASFPSVYIGANGDLANDTYNTWSDSGLPKKISDMSSVPTEFAWSGGSGGKSFNATYDIWFSKTSPTAGSYNDAISGFIMVWLYKPSSKQPIGSVKRTASLAGHTWDVWIGPRGDKSTGTDDANRPVVSYVAQDSPVSSLSFDLKAFFDDAVKNASSDMSAGGTSQAFSDSWYLTDVFGGFEIWSGGDATNLACSKFTCVVK